MMTAELPKVHSRRLGPRISPPYVAATIEKNQIFVQLANLINFAIETEQMLMKAEVVLVLIAMLVLLVMVDVG